MEQKNVSGVARDQNVALVRLEGMCDRPGNVWRVMSLLSAQKINVDIILQPPAEGGKSGMTFSVPRSAVDRTVEVLVENKGALGFESMAVDEHVCKISIVGAGMATRFGIAAQMFEALYKQDISLHCITTSEIKISVIVSDADADRAFIAVHDAFF